MAGGTASAAAVVEIEGIVLRADGGFEPRTLPKRGFAPIDFQGQLDISAQAGGKPEALQRAVIKFDRDGRLTPSGLPTCAPELVAEASAEEARQGCAGAIIGSGTLEMLVALPSGPVTAEAPLTIFNGPHQNGTPTVILHARVTVPATQTFAIVVPIERRRGAFRYRATMDIPPIAGGLGALTHIDIKMGRRFSVGGQRRSFISARCSDYVLQTHGRFTFADGTVIDGDVDKPCTVR